MKGVLKASDVARLTGFHPKYISRLARKGLIGGDRANSSSKQTWWIDNVRIREWCAQRQRGIVKVLTPVEKKALARELNSISHAAEEHAKCAADAALKGVNCMRETGILLQGLRRENRSQLKMNKAQISRCLSIARQNPEVITDLARAIRIMRRNGRSFWNASAK